MVAMEKLSWYSVSPNLASYTQEEWRLFDDSLCRKLRTLGNICWRYLKMWPEVRYWRVLLTTVRVY